MKNNDQLNKTWVIKQVFKCTTFEVVIFYRRTKSGAIFAKVGWYCLYNQVKLVICLSKSTKAIIKKSHYCCWEENWLQTIRIGWRFSLNIMSSSSKSIFRTIKLNRIHRMTTDKVTIKLSWFFRKILRGNYSSRKHELVNGTTSPISTYILLQNNNFCVSYHTPWKSVNIMNGCKVHLILIGVVIIVTLRCYVHWFH